MAGISQGHCIVMLSFICWALAFLFLFFADLQRRSFPGSSAKKDGKTKCGGGVCGSLSGFGKAQRSPVIT